MGVQFADTETTQYARVLYDFNPEENVELLLKVSDVVKIYKFDGEWCYGELDGVKGWFPYNHVENIDEEEYNRLLRDRSSNNESNSNNTGEEQNIQQNIEPKEETKTEVESEHKEEENTSNDKLKALERQIRCSTISTGPSSTSHRISTDGKRSWYSAYQGSIRYKSKNAILQAMKENAPNAEKNSMDKLNSKHSSVDVNKHDTIKAKSDSSLLNNLDFSFFGRSDNRKSEAIEFINGPAKLKMKWVDFIGGQAVVDSMGLSKKNIKRQEVIYEMIDTERDYVNDLSIIIKLYMEPMKKNNLLSKKDINTLFSNIEQLYGVNQELLKLFEERQRQNKYIEEIGDIWLTMLEYLKMYMLYCGNYAYAITQLEDLKSSKSVTKFLNTQFHKKESRSLKLESFLIKPVQRICKYPLLLRELIKCTEESHKDYANLVKAYDKLEIVVTVVNGASKEAEAVHNLIAFQSRFNPKISIVSTSRKIRYKCEVNVYMKKLTSPIQSLSTLLTSCHSLEKKKRLLFIFDDLILFAKSFSQLPDRLDNGKLKLIQKREYSNVELKDADDNSENAIEIMLYNPDILTIVFCDSIETKKAIVAHLSMFLKEYQDINKHESGPKIIKSLPSEKVYSMISNKNQDGTGEEEEEEEEDQEEINTPPPAVKLEEKKEKEKEKEKEKRGFEITQSELLKGIQNIKSGETKHIISTDNYTNEPDKLSPLRNSDISEITNSNLLSFSSIDSFADNPLQSDEPDLLDECQNQNDIKEVIMMLDTFISNSNESINKDTENYMHGKECSVIVKDDDEEVSYKSPFSPTTRRSAFRANGGESKTQSVIIHDDHEINKTLKKQTNDVVSRRKADDNQPEKRRSILNRISFYEKINTSNRDDEDFGDGKNSNVNLSNNYPIKNAIVEDVLCKMKNARKYYVYEINVNLNKCAPKMIQALKNYAENQIKVYHTFEEFFDFHFQFIEAVISNKDNNISINQIPTLPSQVQCVNDRIARKRISGLQSYINGILNLSTTIHSADIVYNFLASSGFDSLKLMEE